MQANGATKTIVIARNYSKFPAGPFPADGEASGTAFHSWTSSTAPVAGGRLRRGRRASLLDRKVVHDALDQRALCPNKRRRSTGNTRDDSSPQPIG